MPPKPSWQILDEYGLTEYLYDVLKLCQTPQFWGRREDRLRHSSQSLYKLCERGWLDGPPKGEIYSQPFVLSETGRELLARLDRGLHKPEWLNKHRARALHWLYWGPTHNNRRKDFATSLTTLRSLERAGYIRLDDGQWRITDLGREAWAEKSKSEVL